MAAGEQASVLTFGLKVGPLEFFWTAESRLVAVKGIETWEQARSFIEHYLGAGSVQGAAFPQTQPASAPAPVQPTTPPPAQPRPALTVVPPSAAAAPAPPVPSPAQQGQLPIAQPAKAGPPQAPPAAPQPAGAPLAEDAVFTRANTVGDVVDEIVRRNPAAQTTREIADLARRLMESVHVPALVALAPEDFDDRVESIAVGALIVAGAR